MKGKTISSPTFIITVILILLFVTVHIIPQTTNNTPSLQTNSPILGPTELHYLADALRSIKMTPQDLLYTKNTHPNLPYRLHQIDSLMANPIQVPFYTDELSQRLSSYSMKPCSLYLQLSNELGETYSFPSIPWSESSIDSYLKESKNPELSNLWDELKLYPEIKEAVFTLYWGDQIASSLIDDAFSNLSEIGHRNLTDSGANFETFLGYETVKQDKLLQAGATVLRTVNLARQTLRNITLDGLSPAKFNLDNNKIKGKIIWYSHTKYGDIIIGDSGPNEYNGDFAIIVDLGGDDIYTNHAGGTDGRTGQRVSICIDMGGNNQFIARNKATSSKKDESDKLLPGDDRLDFCFGGAIAGIGILAVEGNGNNIFHAGNWSLGAAHLGVGILIRDGSGDHSYKGLDCTQGAAAFGVGLLIDQEGNDKYSATYTSQGFGSMAGIGLLLDHSGNDTYYAGGRYEDFPQRPKGSFIAMSQGFGYGIRPVCSGGMGILIDNSGDDQHILDNQFGMGGSYWYGYGILVDDSGNDSYQTGKDGDYDGYTMGAGIHLGIGCMIDRNGDDRYHANKIGPAVGWDLSPSWLIDGGGTDSLIITAKDWNYAFSGVQNGCGFFVKKSGKATFGGTGYFPAGQAERDCGSIGIMVNIGDSGTYIDAGQRMKSGRWFSSDSWCAGLDIPHPGNSYFKGIDSWPTRPPHTAIFSADTLPEEGDSIIPLPEVTSSEWTHDKLQHLWDLCVEEEGSNWSKSDSSRIKFRSLGLPALYFVIPKMASADGYERRCAQTSVTTIGKDHLKILFDHLHIKDAITKRRLILALGNTGDKQATDALLPFLHRPGYRLVTVEALGILKDPKAIGPISELVGTDQFLKSEELRKTIAVALGRIGDSSAIPILIKMLDDSLYWGRYPAELALIAIGENSIPALIDIGKQGKFPSAAHAIEALGRIKDSKSRTADVLLVQLSNPDWLIRGCTIAALGNLGDSTLITTLENIKRTEIHPFVLLKLDSSLAQLRKK